MGGLSIPTTVLVVGVTEDLESFVEVAERLLPRFFQGATAYIREDSRLAEVVTWIFGSNYKMFTKNFALLSKE